MTITFTYPDLQYLIWRKFQKDISVSYVSEASVKVYGVINLPIGIPVTVKQITGNNIFVIIPDNMLHKITPDGLKRMCLKPFLPTSVSDCVEVVDCLLAVHLDRIDGIRHLLDIFNLDGVFFNETGITINLVLTNDKANGTT